MKKYIIVLKGKRGVNLSSLKGEIGLCIIPTAKCKMPFNMEVLEVREA